MATKKKHRRQRRRDDECKNCLNEMAPRPGKDFCSTKCRIYWNNNPMAAGALRKQIRAIMSEVLTEEIQRTVQATVEKYFAAELQAVVKRLEQVVTFRVDAIVNTRLAGRGL